MKLKVATCQFPTDADINKNRKHILTLMAQAKKQGADVAHFPEACLSGYAGVDFASFGGGFEQKSGTASDFDWDLLQQASEEILAQAKELKLWLVLGSSHRLSGDHKPHNSLYIISDEGKIIDRYDKLFCAGDKSGETGDLAHYSSGNHFCVFEINGIRCGAQICHDYRYPELYREYKRQGVQLMFHSFHAGHISSQMYQFMEHQVGNENHQYNPATTIPGITQPAAMHAGASNNYMWISCPNSSGKQSCWASFFIRPDGVITGNVPLHTTGLVISEVDTGAAFYDSTIAWRERVMNGVFHSGDLVVDTRSVNRTRL